MPGEAQTRLEAIRRAAALAGLVKIEGGLIGDVRYLLSLVDDLAEALRDHGCVEKPEHGRTAEVVARCSCRTSLARLIEAAP